MFASRRRAGALAAIAAILLLSTPTPSYALFDWLCPNSGGYQQTATTCYSPPFSGQMIGYAPRYSGLPWRPAVATAPSVVPPTVATCSYVPVTSYRTEYRLAPVSTVQAVAYQEPCSGVPMVTYRPAVNWAYRPIVVPYSTYRIVYSAPVAACAPCVSRPACCPSYVPSATCGAAMPGIVSSPGCASRGRGAPAGSVMAPIPASSVPGMAAPSLPGPMAPTPQSPVGTTLPGPTLPSGTPAGVLPPAGTRPSTFAPGQTVSPAPTAASGQPSSSPGLSGAPSTAAPGAGGPATVPSLLTPSPGQGPNKGYESKPYENRSPIQTQPGLKPTPDSNTGPAPARMPNLGAPQGRTAQTTIRQATYVRPVSHGTQSGSPVRPRQDANGWEAAGN